jgi:hypothetical protein
MSRVAKDLEQRIADLEDALRTIGVIETDPKLKPEQRRERVIGILSLYECEPKPAGPSS